MKMKKRNRHITISLKLIKKRMNKIRILMKKLTLKKFQILLILSLYLQKMPSKKKEKLIYLKLKVLLRIIKIKKLKKK